MVPFIYGSVSSPRCFDESSPCIEEQTAYCVIDIAQSDSPTPSPIPTPTPTPSPTPGCVDKDSASDCSYWKGQGYCDSSSTYHDYMKENCCNTCGFDSGFEESAFPGQDKIVQWQICHSKGSSMSTCHSQVGISSSDVQSCLDDTTRIQGLMQKYLDRGSSVRGTPYEEVNGKEVDSEYAAIKKAICAADSSLSACSGNKVTPPAPPSDMTV